MESESSHRRVLETVDVDSKLAYEPILVVVIVLKQLLQTHQPYCLQPLTKISPTSSMEA